MTPSEQLVAAAELIRDLAGKAEPGPWGYSVSGDPETPDDGPTFFGRADPETGEALTTIAGLYHGKHEGTAAWIAALSPALADPIERWLRETAANAEQSIPAWRNSSVDGYPGPKRTEDEVASLVEHHYGAALALAARVLGEETHG